MGALARALDRPCAFSGERDGGEGVLEYLKRFFGERFCIVFRVVLGEGLSEVLEPKV